MSALQTKGSVCCMRIVIALITTRSHPQTLIETFYHSEWTKKKHSFMPFVSVQLNIYHLCVVSAVPLYIL
jgi:hypothetical protein